MRELTDSGRTVVFATHYLDEADAFADRVVMMSRGGIVADGTPAEVKSVVAGRTLAFSLRSPLGDLAARLRSLPAVQIVEPRADRVRVATTDSDAVLRLVLAERVDAHDVEVTARTMDDAFLALTTAAPAEEASR
jgi:ABC-2 type transport system ATP-binding protein